VDSTTRRRPRARIAAGTQVPRRVRRLRQLSLLCADPGRRPRRPTRPGIRPDPRRPVPVRNGARPATGGVALLTRTFAEMQRTAERDKTRPSIEYYRRHDRISYLPVGGWTRAFLGLGLLFVVTSAGALLRVGHQRRERRAVRVVERDDRDWLRVAAAGMGPLVVLLGEEDGGLGNKLDGGGQRRDFTAPRHSHAAVRAGCAPAGEALLAIPRDRLYRWIGGCSTRRRWPRRRWLPIAR
jgi:hypothetical protein